ncbi:DNA repair protein RadA [Candidatus Shapirobacteria bacterium CG09_land_8_20_14_0_10_39_12]|uniref:DNA repair protein RadA n=1 Tax=Candidatus Shapirobacteria bacterium CG09_land_8_20_14_0_10_39_12 TaxID=1974885 RepID=A0A2H0WPC4_9BACT|nr:MAG: DNA repair protein RadA [Candidatus Shapirobacteria bacterium CG09_land_8_20_14_0_10_39_12]
MSKTKTFFVCQQCGAQFPKWLGRCSECGEWNSLVETPQAPMTLRTSRGGEQALAFEKPRRLSEIKSVARSRAKTKIKELDRVLGGGIVSGSAVLLAGEPGIGKSTLMLQLTAKVAANSSIQNSVLYVSGEESAEQIKIRAQRLGIKGDNLLFLAETNADLICTQISELNLQIAIIDSVQTIWTGELAGTAGSVGQVRESTNRLLRIGKKRGIPIFLIGHVTKTGAIAGPKVLEHMVDTVVYFEGDRFGSVRLLRSTKNRFGPTDEIGIFEMTNQGLIEASNPSRLFLSRKRGKVPGSAVVATLEGTRPMLVEIQALVVPTQLVVPRRIGQGVDYQRLQLITAVLTKKLNLPLAGFDIYVNVTGGLKVEEPAVDLGVALAIISSFKNLALREKTVCFGELGLLGEVRPVSQMDKRKKEARRLGFTTIISPEKYSSIAQVFKQFFK